MINFNLVNIMYKNIVILITSYDISKLYCIGFVIANLFAFQLLSGILLSFLYNNSFLTCWFSILSVNDFEYGFLIRSIHITGTSFIYLTLYVHIYKIFFYNILHNSRFIVWIIGVVIYFLTVVIAFIGYVLPLTQMSYWGLTVFSNILSTIPFLGKVLCFWFWGSEFIQDFTLIKVHSLHIFLPFILIIFIILHFVFINWTFVFHEESFEIVNIMKTSDKIIPEWFFLTFFGFIKAIPDKFGGVCVLLFFVIVFFITNFFIIHIQRMYIYSNILFYFTINIFYLLSIIGLLSTNVILIFPILLLLQLYVFFLIAILFYKVF